MPTASSILTSASGWAEASSILPGPSSPSAELALGVKINGQPLHEPQMQAGFLRIHRSWQPGDRVEIEIPLPVRRVYADARVATNRSRVALERGPIVYCAESADNPDGVLHLLLPPDAEVKVEFKPDLLGGLPVLRCRQSAFERTAPPNRPNS